MTILTINAGSSSLRLALFTTKGDGVEVLAVKKYKLEEINSSTVLSEFIQGQENVSIITHRVVHGGTKFVESCLIDTAVEEEIARLSPLAPLHNPFALKWIQICRAIFGQDIPQVAVFDTAFYSTLPEVATIYALPQTLCSQHHIRRYGFHGIAHKTMWSRWQAIHPELQNGGKIISLQLGAGCSITAVQHGKAIDTSMGFSPLEGLMMATRSGDIDPGLIPYLQRSCGLSIEQVEELLNHSSGLLGVSGISNDMRLLLKSNLQQAKLAVKLFCYRAKKHIGAYLSVLQGADAIVFGGGIGENAPEVRRLILEDMEWLGIILDNQANYGIIGKEGCLSSPKSKIEVWVIPVDEAYAMAREAIRVQEVI
ncbi:MAG: acetate/propionate family kinase [bacterium]|nr:acetate/propionate family kinase [bacterium]